jgi:3-hydroxyacyl-CoA dehydrogenase/enoyl-CoA hydratase/3-hydroxybutyryl-CoA epimerase
MRYANFRLEIDADGIATVTWDMPGRSMNVFDLTVMDELGAIIDEIVGNAAITGVVIASGKETFSGGADLAMLDRMLGEFRAAVAAGQREAAMARLYAETFRLGDLFRRLETCGKPVVAAINGTCLGGAFELALACHGRIAAGSDHVRVGLPEVRVGLLPGAGGTQRVARLVTTQDALTILLKGEQLKPARAKALGLLDAVVPPGDLLAAARRWLKETPRKVAPWDEDGFKGAGPKVFSPQGFNLWPAANAHYRKETHDNYPGARALLSALFEGLQLPFDQALKVEQRYFAQVLQKNEAAAMIRSLFVSLQELNKLARRPADVPASEIGTLGILGAGFMGAGIATVAARAGIAVILLDRDAAAAAAGKAAIAVGLDKEVARGRLQGAEREAALARIATGSDMAALGDADLVIEAVFEDRAVKADVIARAFAAMRPGTILGSNTSTLPIASLAAAAPRPADVIGIHFFSPVEKMMLVEVITAPETGTRALATALDFVRRIRKTPIVVNDSRGFYTSRVVTTYIGEGHRMLAEGVPPAMIENVARLAGMPVGPLALNDEVAIDLSLRIMDATRADLGADAVPEAAYGLIRAMVHDHGRLGRKNGKGFYDYPANPAAKKRLWPGLADLHPARRDVEAIDVADLKHRFLAIMALETARCFAEGVLTDVREADVGAILGFGFPPFTGGPLSYIDFMGTGAFVARLDDLAARHGPRFAPNPLLRDLARTGETFYGRFPPGAAAGPERGQRDRAPGAGD